MRTCGVRARIARRSRRDIRVTFRSTWAIIAGCGARTDLVRFADPITALDRWPRGSADRIARRGCRAPTGCVRAVRGDPSNRSTDAVHSGPTPVDAHYR